MRGESRGISTGMPLSPALPPVPGRPEPGLLGVFADLELEAEGLHLDQRAAEAADLAVAEYAGVTLAARLLGSVDAEVRLRLDGGLEVGGRVARAGDGWVVLRGQATWLVPAAAITTAEGLAARAVATEARTVLARLSLASVLRRLAQERTPVLVHLRDASRLDGALARVGADFVEVAGPRARIVTFAALAAVQEIP